LDFLGFSEFSENFWRILEVLEEFCNVERRLEGGDGPAPGFFGKMKMDYLDFLFGFLGIS